MIVSKLLMKIRRKVKKYSYIKKKKDVVDKKMGFSRGMPIDRFYIEQFLENNGQYIQGAVFEIAESTYTFKYGSNVEKAIVFTADNSQEGENVVIGDLATGEGCKEESADCFILTQTLPFIYDVRSAVKNVYKILKQNGVALITVRGISMISKYDEKRWGDYWGFTKQSLEKLTGDCFGLENVEIRSYGNPKVASAFLYGFSQEDINEEDFMYNSDYTPIIITAVCKKRKFGA
ncbi:MAG: methyltransferase domain-containing protein [Floccifex sp.]